MIATTKQRSLTVFKLQFCILQSHKRADFTRCWIRHHFCFTSNDVYISIFYYVLECLDRQSGIERQLILSDGGLRTIHLIKHKKIAHGSVGSVYPGEIQDTGVEVAIKQVDVNCQHKKVQEMLHALQQEIEILRKLSHKNIVKCHGMLKGNDSADFRRTSILV